MPFNLLHRVVSFFLPAGLLFMLMVLLSGHTAAAARLASLSDIYYYVAVSFALMLGWRFDRSLLIFATALIAMAIWLLNHFGAHNATGRIVADVVAVLLPLNLLLFSLLKERGTLTLHGLLRWAIILLQPPLVWLLFHYQRYDWLGVFDTTFITSTTLEEFKLHQPAQLAFAVTLLVSGYRAIRHDNPLLTAIFWAVALLFYTLLQGFPTALTTALFSSAILILIITVLDISYTMAFRDELTGLTGRRALNQALPKLGSRYTIAMLDIDHFKKFNDSYGHDVGDDALQMVAARMSRITGGGKVYRYGGEEFTILFPGKGIDEAQPHLEKLREEIASAGFTVREKKRPGRKPEKAREGSDKRVQITISIGVAERESDTRDPEEVVRAADKALYRAKKAGRNCVSI